MDNLANIQKRQHLERLLKAGKPKQTTPVGGNDQKIIEESFRVFVSAASQANSDSKFLDELRKLTGHQSVESMVKRFRKLAGIDK
jgi:hypothetical protein